MHMKDKMVWDVLGGSCVSGMFYISNADDRNPVEQKSTEIIIYLFCCFQVKITFESHSLKNLNPFPSYLSLLSSDLVRIQTCFQQQVLFLFISGFKESFIFN